MAKLANCAKQLSKLIPMLGSPNDGERLNAVAAIDRVLRGNRLSWHDLSRAVTGVAPVPEVVIETASRREPPQERGGWSSMVRRIGADDTIVLTHFEATSLREMDRTLKNGGKLGREAIARLKEIYARIPTEGTSAGDAS